MLIEDYVKQLIHQLRVTQPVSIDEQRVIACFLTMPLNIKALDPGMRMWTAIAPCPLERREELFVLLMDGNLLGQGTEGGVLSLDPEGNFLTLTLDLPYDMNFEAFHEATEDFVNVAWYWKQQVEKHRKRL